MNNSKIIKKDLKLKEIVEAIENDLEEEKGQEQVQEDEYIQDLKRKKF